MKKGLLPFLLLLIQTIASFSQVPTNGLVGYWPLDGSADDSSGYGNDGIINGAFLNDDRFGVPNRAYYFDGSSDILIQNSSSLNPTTAMTICAWFRPDGFVGNGYGAIFDKGFTSHSAPTYQYKLGATGDGYSSSPATFGFSITVGGVEHRLMTPSGFWTVGQYYFIVGNYDGQSMKLFVNDSLIASVNLSGNISTYATQSMIGNNTTATDRIEGNIDEILIYNRSLTGPEMTSIYEEGSVGISENMNFENIFSVQNMNGANDPMLVFKSNLPGNTTVEVLDMTGRLISTSTHQSVVIGTVISPDFSSCKSAVYMLRISNGKERWLTKVVFSGK